MTVSVDARAPSAAQLEGLIDAIGFKPTWRQDPVAMSGPPLDALRSVLPAAPELVSGAGHDAMVLAAAGVETAMLFVRSLNGGVSHCPDELSAEEDVALAVDALTAALQRIVGGRGRLVTPPARSRHGQGRFPAVRSQRVAGGSASSPPIERVGCGFLRG